MQSLSNSVNFIPWGVTCRFEIIELFHCRCGDGIEGLREQGHTNAVVCKFLEDFDALFEV